MTSREPEDPYVVLGVSRRASASEIARAYRRAARASHPDSSGVGSAERFRAVTDAYDELRDPGRRALYDRSRTPDPPGGSVRYAAPGSRHVVLGRPAPAVTDQAPRGDLEEMLRFALSWLRAGW
jgi:curved DNA-binding protein CbpA